MKIHLAADHAGFELKERIKALLAKKGHQAVDTTPDFKEGDDYPLAAKAFAKQLAGRGTSGAGRAARGILLCGSGVGVCIAANRYKGIRAAVGHTTEEIKLAREHNDINVLCLPGRKQTDDKALLKMIDVFLKTKTSSADRHARRVKLLG